MPVSPVEPITQFAAESLKVKVYENGEQAGQAAARSVAGAIAARQSEAKSANVIFAADPNHDPMLASLTANGSVDWSSVVAFHMDEYVGMPAEHPASFRTYLRKHIFGLVTPREVHLIRGDAERALPACLEYEDLLIKYPVDIVCAGIGENGHLAFNDPHVADFLDPVLVKVVRLDSVCREQQVHEGCFSKLSDVPLHAITVTLPALLRAATIEVIVLGATKANAVRAALQGPVSESCPSSALRHHAGATLYLDRESARGVL